ncbi:uncharacterized protein SCHCODRAFT_02661889 [Schizophyllum commune H4-8]|uniref:uncharacterized protein n=1 Tax=Schizophyllum commune (strain H4-8 / FGSC 9210) TaxID=578458 RepID=UPI0021607394|nr:uncharacterized protein SCHCODRAFT_02661889 [Schizophyllum commune H4-8]KAI5900365.1 hypothetical protein SCHCODRAFT_02661889 [Schizophyllum commune H4-8]
MSRPVDEVLRDARTVVNITHFRDGHMPTDREVETIWQKSIGLHILEYKLVAQIATLQKDLDAVREQVALHRGLVSCYRRVPPEILSDIFVLALPNDWDKRWNMLGTRQRVLNFASVCTSWRAVALTMTPKLWTTLNLCDGTFRAMQRHPWALEMELAKTGQAQLDLHICISPFRSPGAENLDDFWHDRSWGLLCAQSHRWRQLSLDGAPMSAYNDLVGREFPLLTRLSAVFSSYQWAADTTVPLHVFETTNAIEDLSVEYDCTIRDLEIPRTWKITSLDIQCTTEFGGSILEPCLDAIIACRDTLQSCTLSSETDSALANAQLRPTQFPHLRILTLYYHAILLCPCFAVPNLGSLHLYRRIYDEIDPYEALTSLLDCSENCTSLRSLWLHGLPPSPNQDSITGILRRIPYLEDLELANIEDPQDLDDVFVRPELLHAMTRDPDTPDSFFFLPKLKRLVVVTQFPDVDYDEYPAYRQAMRDLLASRRCTYRDWNVDSCVDCRTTSQAAMPRSVTEAIRDARTVANMAHLRDGYIPSDLEAAAIRLKAEQLHKIDLELGEQIASLQADRNAIRRQIAVHRALVSSYRRIPAEILSEIFTLALPDDWGKRKTMLGTRRRVLDFAGVCTSWRTVAHTMMPRLWTELRIDDRTFRAMKRHPWAMEVELAKTGQAPLDLHIRIPSSWTLEGADDFWHDKSWELLCAQSHRWRRMSVDGVPLSAYSSLAGREFPLLTHLYVNFYGEQSRPAAALPLGVFESATHVTDLRIDYNFTIRVLELPPAWAITSLNIDCSGDRGCSLEPCLEAVKACSQSLESCMLLSRAYLELSPAQREPESFPRLRTLSLFYFAVLLCPCFAAPNITTLDLHTRLYEDLHPYEALLSLLNHSEDCRSLISLSLDGLPPPPEFDSVTRILRRLPHLKDLELMNNEFIEEFRDATVNLELLRLLTRDLSRPESMSFLPALTRLYVATCAAYGGDEYMSYHIALRNLLDSRSNALRVGSVDLAPLRYLYSDALVSHGLQLGWIMGLPVALGRGEARSTTYKGIQRNIVNTEEPEPDIYLHYTLVIASTAQLVYDLHDRGKSIHPELVDYKLSGPICQPRPVVAMPRSVVEAIRDARTVADIALLRDGHIPSNSEAVAIERKADDLKKIGLELAEKIAGLRADQEAIRRQVAVHRALVSSYRRIPPEILSEIFILALPDDWQERPARIGTRPRVLAFAEVCTSWRAVALTMTPQFWSTLSIDDRVFNAMQRHPWAFEMELAKAGQAPLDLRIRMPTSLFSESVQPFWSSEAWSRLHAQSHRLRRLSLHGAPLSAYNDLAGRALPLLTRFSFDFLWQYWQGSDVALPLHLLEHATHVTDLRIEYSCTLRKLELPRTWVITSLDLDCREGDDATLIPYVRSTR